MSQRQSAKVERYYEALDFTFSCGEFDVAQEGWVTGFVTTFFDGSDEPIRLHIHERFFATLTNLETGYTLTDGPDSFFVRIDLVNGTESVRGLYFMLRDSTGEKVAIDVGKITYFPDGSVSVSGPHDVYEAGGEVCSFLDP